MIDINITLLKLFMLCFVLTGVTSAEEPCLQIYNGEYDLITPEGYSMRHAMTQVGCEATSSNFDGSESHFTIGQDSLSGEVLGQMITGALIGQSFSIQWSNGYQSHPVHNIDCNEDDTAFAAFIQTRIDDVDYINIVNHDGCEVLRRDDAHLVWCPFSEVQDACSCVCDSMESTSPTTFPTFSAPTTSPTEECEHIDGEYNVADLQHHLTGESITLTQQGCDVFSSSGWVGFIIDNTLTYTENSITYSGEANDLIGWVIEFEDQYRLYPAHWGAPRDHIMVAVIEAFEVLEFILEDEKLTRDELLNFLTQQNAAFHLGFDDSFLISKGNAVFNVLEDETDSDDAISEHDLNVLENIVKSDAARRLQLVEELIDATRFTESEMEHIYLVWDKNGNEELSWRDIVHWIRTHFPTSFFSEEGEDYLESIEEDINDIMEFHLFGQSSFTLAEFKALVTAAFDCAHSTFENVLEMFAAEEELSEDILMDFIECIQDQTGFTPKPTMKPSTSPTMMPSVIPTASSPSAQPSNAPSFTDPSSAPTESPTDSPSTSRPTFFPTTDEPSFKPTYVPSVSPSKAPTSSLPTSTPSVDPTTEDPTFAPTTEDPTMMPTDAPVTSRPTLIPTTSRPTFMPSCAPSTSTPTYSPSLNPTTEEPSKTPTFAPTMSTPTASPSATDPTVSPSASSPTSSPTATDPTVSPTKAPVTSKPTLEPSVSPSSTEPTCKPSLSPSLSPSSAPSSTMPSSAPTKVPTTEIPTQMPTKVPTTEAPTTSPESSEPTFAPTFTQPSVSPSPNAPTNSPSASPTVAPVTSEPSFDPTEAPSTTRPTMRPTLLPTTEKPTMVPTNAPTSSIPTMMPTDAPVTPRPSFGPTTSNPTFDPTSSKPTFMPTFPPSTSRPTFQPTEDNQLSFDLRGRSGLERVIIKVGGVQVHDITLSTTWQTFSFPMPANKVWSVDYKNDAGGRDVYYRSDLLHTMNFRKFGDWNCGSRGENSRCRSARDFGLLNWGGEYTYTLFESTDCAGDEVLAADCAKLTFPAQVMDDTVVIPNGFGNNGAGRIEFTIFCEANAANLEMQAEGFWPNGKDNSYYIQLDGQNRKTMHTGSNKNNFYYRDAPRLGVPAYGFHTVTLQHREDGTTMRRMRITSSGCRFADITDQYVKNVGGANLCDSGARITEEAECQAVAAIMGMPYGGAHSLDYCARGCFVYDGPYTQYHGVYLNIHPTGAQLEDHHLLCKANGRRNLEELKPQQFNVANRLLLIEQSLPF